MEPPAAPAPFRSRSWRKTMHSSGPTLFSSTSVSWPSAHSEFCEASSRTRASCDRPPRDAHSAFINSAAARWFSARGLPQLPTNSLMHCVRRTALSERSPPLACCLTNLNKLTNTRSTSLRTDVSKPCVFKTSLVMETPTIAERRKSPPSNSDLNWDFLPPAASLVASTSSSPSCRSYTFSVPYVPSASTTVRVVILAADAVEDFFSPSLADPPTGSFLSLPSSATRGNGRKPPSKACNTASTSSCSSTYSPKSHKQPLNTRDCCTSTKHSDKRWRMGTRKFG
mmetsp:Transcript_60458/g.184697  ORF Transcript_60458/g.184697 Transcript_60458/m.184697 type:complete len:283 (+) Transcript_60458:994-1842(+)